ncbi:hypothetical protein LDENG_00192800, partial [Lucifuga dentata]
ESILSSCNTVWFGNCKASDRKSLQRIVRTAEKIIQVPLPAITDIFHKHPLQCPPLWLTPPTPLMDCSPSCHLAEDTGNIQAATPDYRTVSSWRQSGSSAPCASSMGNTDTLKYIKTHTDTHISICDCTCTLSEP